MVPTWLSGVAVPPLWLDREVLLQTNSAGLRDLRWKTPHQRRPREHCSRLPPISELPKCIMYIAYIMPLFNYAANGHSSPGSPRLASCGRGVNKGCRDEGISPSETATRSCIGSLTTSCSHSHNAFA